VNKAVSAQELSSKGKGEEGLEGRKKGTQREGRPWKRKGLLYAKKGREVCGTGMNTDTAKKGKWLMGADGRRSLGERHAQGGINGREAVCSA